MIFKYKPDSEFYTDERCYLNELFNRAEDAGCSVARARVKPGVTTQLHALKDTKERYVILEGSGTVEIDGGDPTIVSLLDVVYIPKGVPQRITNTGIKDLIFLVICTPSFQTEIYENLEG